jgi:hypothetical protein
MTMYSDERKNYILALQKEIVEICDAVIHGNAGVIFASRKLRDLHYQMFDNVDDDFRIFIGIESETDELPIGDERQYWDAAVLTEKDKEIAEYEKKAEKDVIESCRRLIDRFTA